jgi:hypothetical protein
MGWPGPKIFAPIRPMQRRRRQKNYSYLCYSVLIPRLQSAPTDNTSPCHWVQLALFTSWRHISPISTRHVLPTVANRPFFHRQDEGWPYHPHYKWPCGNYFPITCSQYIDRPPDDAELSWQQGSIACKDKYCIFFLRATLTSDHAVPEFPSSPRHPVTRFAYSRVAAGYTKVLTHDMII